MPSLSGRPVIIHVFLGSEICVSHLGHLALSSAARKYICPLMVLVVIFLLFTRSYSRVVKSAMAKVDICAISGLLKSVWKYSIPPIISWDVKAFSPRSLRKRIMSSSSLLRGFPSWNSSFSMGIRIAHFPFACAFARVGLGCRRRGI